MNRSLTTLGAILMLATAALPSVSAAAVIVQSAKQLSSEPQVRQWIPMYNALVAANIAYAKCGEDYAITDVQRSYLADLYGATAKNYAQSYMDVYTRLVGAPPTQAMADEIGKLVTDQQGPVVNQTTQAIQDHGCGHPTIQSIVTYPEKYRYTNQPGIQNQRSE